MGDTYQSIVDLEATPEEAPDLAKRVLDFLLQQEVIAPGASPDCVLGGTPGYRPGPKSLDVQVEASTLVFDLATNGVQAITERHVYFCVCSEVTCPSCGHNFGLEFPAAIESKLEFWWKDGGDTGVECPHCHKIRPFETWFSPPWALAYLGFTFWNWWSLRQEFVSTIRDLLGHNIVVVSGKL